MEETTNYLFILSIQRKTRSVWPALPREFQSSHLLVFTFGLLKKSDFPSDLFQSIALHIFVLATSHPLLSFESIALHFFYSPSRPSFSFESIALHTFLLTISHPSPSFESTTLHILYDYLSLYLFLSDYRLSITLLWKYCTNYFSINYLSSILSLWASAAKCYEMERVKIKKITVKCKIIHKGHDTGSKSHLARKTEKWQTWWCKTSALGQMGSAGSLLPGRTWRGHKEPNLQKCCTQLLCTNIHWRVCGVDKIFEKWVLGAKQWWNIIKKH